MKTLVKTTAKKLLYIVLYFQEIPQKRIFTDALLDPVGPPVDRLSLKPLLLSLNPFLIETQFLLIYFVCLKGMFTCSKEELLLFLIRYHLWHKMYFGEKSTNQPFVCTYMFLGLLPFLLYFVNTVLVSCWHFVLTNLVTLFLSNKSPIDEIN